MLRRALLFVLCLWTVAFSTGCGAQLVPFSHELRDRNGLTTEDMKNLQYYISRRVVLRRELTSDAKEVTGNHQLVLVSGRRVEEVVIEEHTPGVAVAIGSQSITVSFEPGSAMVFSAQGGADDTAHRFAEAPPNPFPGDESRAREPLPFPSSSLSFGNYTLATEGPRSILYEGKRFDVVGQSGEAALMIDAHSLEEVSLNRKYAPGMRLR